MKKYFLVFAMMAVMNLWLSKDVYAQGYLFISGGGAGSAKAGSVGVEAGKMFPRRDPQYLLGGSFSVALNGSAGASVPPVFESKIRHEQEINGVAGFRFARGLFFVGTAGVSSQTEKDVFHFPGQPQEVDQIPLHTFFSGSGQFRYIHKKLMVGVGYHSRRGIIGGFGFTF